MHHTRTHTIFKVKVAVTTPVHSFWQALEVTTFGLFCFGVLRQGFAYVAQHGLSSVIFSPLGANISPCGYVEVISFLFKLHLCYRIYDHTVNPENCVPEKPDSSCGVARPKHTPLIQKLSVTRIK